MPLLKKHIFFFLVFLFPLLLTAQTVYTTPSGQKYHMATCRMVKNVSKEVEIKEAIQTGYTQCKICRPPIVSNGNTLSIHKAKGKDKTVQCSGLTKARTRCKHKTSIANGLCYQHQG